MIRITRLTDYGIVLLSQMALSPERRFNAPDLASETSLLWPLVCKILERRARSGLLLSHRGVLGGYGLGAPGYGLMGPGYGPYADPQMLATPGFAAPWVLGAW